jgi:hypothetical protein
MIDVYDVLKAFNVVNPATQHAIKKLLKGVSVDIIAPETLEHNIKLDRAYMVAKQFFKL